MKADQQQHDDQVAAGQQLDDLGHHQADAGQRHGADDDAGRRGGDADADHVARADLQAADQVAEAAPRGPAVAAVRRGTTR